MGALVVLKLTRNLLHCSVLNVNASDLPVKVKTNLQFLAHDLSGALVFDYGGYFLLCFIFISSVHVIQFYVAYLHCKTAVNIELTHLHALSVVSYVPY